MAIEEQIKKKTESLISQAESLSRTNVVGQALSRQQMQECSGWMAAALHLVQLVVPNPTSGYRVKAEEIAQRPVTKMIASHVGEFCYLLKNLLGDIDLGLLSSLADHARAEIFDDFLDHAKSYLKDNRKNEAGVIAGVIFEDSLRKVCQKNGVTEKGRKLDELITDLTKLDVISQTKAKRARVAADVRTKATHAQWDDFDANDVKVTIEFTQEFIASKLDAAS